MSSATEYSESEALSQLEDGRLKVVGLVSSSESGESRAPLSSGCIAAERMASTEFEVIVLAAFCWGVLPLLSTVLRGVS